ncbi:hypothetical protein CK203_003725 [Vitis vinifera]|uniref:Uncharacterized protein n=1 Tax=Vitis vinifera TaxID=29760 RepID=A0A438EX93_VITVI|nr:hypothetical protein CK203_093403 [Vitis vinifera]RVX17496.1 hypothetical protein CK203_003725 [Vitis vinifera]
MTFSSQPRRGCFEIREEGGEKYISLLKFLANHVIKALFFLLVASYLHVFNLQDMKRPFAPMKALDMDKVISDIIDKIK